MALSPGTRLGPYEILSPIGAGGRGEVYKAKENLLDRTVAIKGLFSHLADNLLRPIITQLPAATIGTPVCSMALGYLGGG